MALVINCECGFVVRGKTEDEFVAAAQAHSKDAHKMEITRQQALSIAETVEDD
jgi:predicted small metal-binding protein